MATLIQLPNNASTSKYPKTFPQPHNLMALYNTGDVIIDLAALCFKLRQEEVLGIIDDFFEYEYNIKDHYVINAGDYPPDAAYFKYYRYFFNKMQAPYLAVGTYSKINRKELAKRYKFFHFHHVQTKHPRYDVIDYEIYPKVDGKLKASIRASWGCPRKCSMCPVPKYFGSEYIYYDPIDICTTVKYLYEERGIRYFTFIDDNLSYHPDFVKLLLMLRSLKFKGVRYHCQEGFDLGTFDIKRARLIKALKFEDIKIAFETIISRTTKLINKSSINPDSIQKALEVIRFVGLKVKSFLLLGLDETEDEVIQNLKFFAENNMTLRVNIVRDYGNYDIKPNLDDKKLRDLKSLAYASSFFTEQFGFNIFTKDIDAFIKATGLEYDYLGTIVGKTKYGFQTSRFEKGIKYIFHCEIESNDGEQLRLGKDLEEVGKNREEKKDSGFTADALAKSRKIRQEFLNKFGYEGKVPTSILLHDRKEYRYETIDLSAQRRGGNYVHHYRKNRQKMHERKDYTPGLEKTGFETQGRTDYISGFPQNVGRFIIELYCPERAIIYDPFAGHNSRMQLCYKMDRNYIGVDICHEFMEDNKAVKEMLYSRKRGQIIQNYDNWILLFEQSSESVPTVIDDYAQFTITSPPYWDLEFYGPEEEQLGTGKTYDQFLEGIERVIKENYRVLAPGSFCAWFINDFRKNKKLYPYHSHIYEILERAGFEGFNIYIVDLGATVNHMFVQDIINNKLLPKRHEYCVLVRKPGPDWWDKTK